jgi:transcriptional regulator with XRE-family HTH domain
VNLNINTKKRLARAGWRAGSASDFLELSPEEASFIDLKLALAGGMRKVRERSGLTQTEVAARLGSSQSRVAKMEAGNLSVSLDLLVKSLLRIGASPTEIGKWIRSAETKRAAKPLPALLRLLQAGAPEEKAAEGEH